MEDLRNQNKPKGQKNSASLINPANLYITWYDFKKALEKQLGYSLLNWRWLEARPRGPLPWHDSDMKATLSTVARLRKVERANKGRHRKLMLKGHSN